jgi:hypothetical protein
MIVIDKFPPYANTDEIGLSIASRAQEHPWHACHPELGTVTGLPVKNVVDLTAQGDYWYARACQPTARRRRSCATSS